MNDPRSIITQARLIELVETLIAIPSVTGQEQPLADWVFDFFTSLGLQGVQRLPVAGAGDSVAGWIEGIAPGPTLLFNFHLDTFAAFDGWQTDPFTPHRAQNRLYGLGAHDMKGGAACVLAAVEALVRCATPLAGRLLVAATSDEENWSRGAHALIARGLLDDCMGCLIPEPAPAGTLTVGARGRHVYHFTFFGHAVHSAYDRGVNALVDAARVVNALAAPAAVDLGYNAEFAISGSQCVIGLQSGGQLVLVPERADLYVDRFTLPGEDAENVAAQLRAVVDRAQIQGRYQLTWDERPTPAPQAYVVPADHPLVRTTARALAAAADCDVRPVLARSVADTNHFAVHGGVPTLICGPQGGNTCEANEYVCVDSLPAIAHTYLQVAQELLSPPGA